MLASVPSCRGRRRTTFAVISAPLDFLGVNYYRRNVVQAGAGVVTPRAHEHTAMGWEIGPEFLYELLV